MKQDEVIFRLKSIVHSNQHYTTWTVSTPHLVQLVNSAIEAEREAVAKMIEDAPALMDFARNDQGGCLMCGFTPKLAAQFIRARGNT
jgi:hypothetical protein